MDKLFDDSPQSPETIPAHSPRFVDLKPVKGEKSLRANLLDRRWDRLPLHEGNSDWMTEQGLANPDISTIAAIQAGAMELHLLDLRGTKPENNPLGPSLIHFTDSDRPLTIGGDYLLVSDEFFTTRGETGYQEIPHNSSYTFGRNDTTISRFGEIPMNVSREHFTINTVGENPDGHDTLKVIQNSRTNKTRITYGERLPESTEIQSVGIDTQRSLGAKAVESTPIAASPEQIETPKTPEEIDREITRLRKELAEARKKLASWQRIKDDTWEKSFKTKAGVDYTTSLQQANEEVVRYTTKVDRLTEQISALETPLSA